MYALISKNGNYLIVPTAEMSTYLQQGYSVNFTGTYDDAQKKNPNYKAPEPTVQVITTQTTDTGVTRPVIQNLPPALVIATNKDNNVAVVGTDQNGLSTTIDIPAGTLKQPDVTDNIIAPKPVVTQVNGNNLPPVLITTQHDYTFYYIAGAVIILFFIFRLIK